MIFCLQTEVQNEARRSAHHTTASSFTHRSIHIHLHLQSTAISDIPIKLCQCPITRRNMSVQLFTNFLVYHYETFQDATSIRFLLILEGMDKLSKGLD